MKKEIVEVPVLSAAVRALGVPLSLVTKATEWRSSRECYRSNFA